MSVKCLMWITLQGRVALMLTLNQQGIDFHVVIHLYSYQFIYFQQSGLNLMDLIWYMEPPHPQSVPSVIE